MSIAVLNPSRLAFDERALEVVDRGEGDRVEHEIERRRRSRLASAKTRATSSSFWTSQGVIELGADRVGELADAPLHLVAGQVGEADLRPLVQELSA